MGPLEVAILVLFVFVPPAIILYRVAKGRGRSGQFAWWALLGWLGLIVGLLILLATNAPERAETRPAPSPLGMDATAERLRTLSELHERGLLTDEEYAERRAREVEQI